MKFFCNKEKSSLTELELKKDFEEVPLQPGKVDSCLITLIFFFENCFFFCFFFLFLCFYWLFWFHFCFFCLELI